MTRQDFVDFEIAEKMGRMVADAIQHERARCRREEVEPLREALRGLIDATNESPYGYPEREAARAALHAADEGRIEP